MPIFLITIAVTINCPKLWKTPPTVLTPIADTFSFNIFLVKIIPKKLKIVPPNPKINVETEPIIRVDKINFKNINHRHSL